MQLPQNVQVDIEEQWYGFESVGRNMGEPAIYLYYGDEGVDRHYTTESVTSQLKGWGWTDKISSYNVDIVFSSVENSATDPLESQYVEEIEAFLQLQDHRDIRVETSGSIIPEGEMDDLVDYYTVMMSHDEFRDAAENRSEAFNWFSNESHRRDRVDFIFSHSGKSRVRQDIQRLRKEFLVPHDRVWFYPEDKSDYQKTAKLAKEFGFNICTPPNTFKNAIEDIDGEDVQ